MAEDEFKGLSFSSDIMDVGACAFFFPFLFPHLFKIFPLGTMNWKCKLGNPATNS